MNLTKLLELILYGDIHEAPYNILGDMYNPKNCIDLDDEQNTRLAIPATIKQLADQG